MILTERTATRGRLETESSRKGQSNPRAKKVKLGLLLDILGEAT